MGKRDTFWSSLPRDESGDIDWPNNNDDRSAMAADIVGARIIGAVEAALETRLKMVAGDAADTDPTDYGDVLSTLSDEQKTAVADLLRDVSFGSLYWMLVKLRDCPSLAVDISLEPWQNDQALQRVQLTDESELHHWYFDWMEKFSEYPAEQ